MTDSTARKIFAAPERNVDHQFQASTLEHLRALSQQATLLNEVQEGSNHHATVLSKLKRKAQELERQHSELKQQLHIKAKLSMRDLLRKTEGEIDDELERVPLSAAASEQILETAQVKQRQRAAQELHVAYRLAGRTVARVDANRLAVRFETSYNGRYYESYYVILEHDADSDALRLFKHTLPYFVPARALADEFLEASARLFMDKVDSYLRAYVSRRQQMQRIVADYNMDDSAPVAAVDAHGGGGFGGGVRGAGGDDARADGGAGGVCTATESYDAVKIERRSALYTLEVYLAYDDLQRELPTRAEVHKVLHRSGANNGARARSVASATAARFFERHVAPTALAMAIDEVEQFSH